MSVTVRNQVKSAAQGQVQVRLVRMCTHLLVYADYQKKLRPTRPYAFHPSLAFAWTSDQLILDQAEDEVSVVTSKSVEWIAALRALTRTCMCPQAPF